MTGATPIDPEGGPSNRTPAGSAAPSARTRLHRRVARTALTAGAVALALALVVRALRPAHAMPVYGHLPSFQLIDERGAAFAPESMLGHVNVVDFIFTRCTSSCPRLTARMAEVQTHLTGRGADVRFVSFSVDPENDTPPVLAAYAAKAHADPARWRFVTGPLDAIERAVVLGFKVAAAKIAKGADDYEVTHGEWFVLVDRAGDIRGYYPTDEASDVDALVRDVLRLDRR